MPDHDDDQTPPEPQSRRLDQPPRPSPEPEPDHDREKLQKALDAERESKRKIEKQLKDLERWKREADEAVEQKKASELSEVERLRKDTAEQAKKLRELEQQSAADRQALIATQLNVEIERQAAGMDYQYPATVPHLVDRSRIVIDPETNQADPKDIKDALDKLAKKYPGMLSSRPGGGTPPREGPRRPAPMNGGRPYTPAAVGEDLESFIGGY